MNHRDRDAHRYGFTMSKGYTPAPKTNLWSTIVGKIILLSVGSIFAVAILKVVW